MKTDAWSDDRPVRSRLVVDAKLYEAEAETCKSHVIVLPNVQTYLTLLAICDPHIVSNHQREVILCSIAKEKLLWVMKTLSYCAICLSYA